MYDYARMVLFGCWLAFAYVFLFRAQRPRGRRASATVRRAMWGLVLETVATLIAWYRLEEMPGTFRTLASMVLAPIGVALGWWATDHLGRQFRVQAGLWPDHQLVRSGPYALVRHPIYLALFLMMLSTALLRTTWPLTALAVVLYAAGTEIRVRLEDRLLAARFGSDFDAYRRRVRAWLPPVR